MVVNVRWIQPRDLSEMLTIEQASFEYPWTEDDFRACLRQEKHTGMVAERNGRVAGFMVYEFYGQGIRLLNFAVHPACRGEGIGSEMVWRLVEKLSTQGRREIVLEVRETNLNAQLFFKSLSFTAISILHGRYDDTDEDAYLMRFRLGGEPEPNRFAPRNRISDHLSESEVR